LDEQVARADGLVEEKERELEEKEAERERRIEERERRIKEWETIKVDVVEYRKSACLLQIFPEMSGIHFR